jgi:hypothetical protein
MTQITTENPFPTRTFTVADPRTFDGDPFEVAERAVAQAAAVAGVLDQMLDAANKMARNAEMERAFIAHEEPQGSEWHNTPIGKRFEEVHQKAASIYKTLGYLKVAAGYNPRKPPKG